MTQTTVDLTSKRSRDKYRPQLARLAPEVSELIERCFDRIDQLEAFFLQPFKSEP